MHIARSMECLMDDAGYMAVYRQRGLIIGISKVEAALRLNVNDPWKLMLTLIY
jgi:hypothetical protein